MAADRKRRRKRSSAVMLLNGLLTIVVIGMVVVAAATYFAVRTYYAEGPRAEETAFLVEKGTGIGTIANRLEEQGLIENALLFRGAAQLTKNNAKILPGQYMVPAHASMAAILDIITETKPMEFFVNVIPGETSWQVAEHINDPAQNLTGAAVPAPIEGTLLAVRHDFFPGDSRKSLIEAMEKAMADQVAAIWAARDPAIDDVVKSPKDLVTLASLVEKETGLETERPQVASVFVNRLRKHMRLQTDPSVIYGLTLGKGKLERALTTADLKAKTPYNTYQIDGLPAGPIANPGVEALKAVAHPAGASFLYFVARSADPADGHLFAATYAEHKKNVALYRKAAAADEAEAAKEALEAEQASEAGDTTQ
ncbi:MAG: endolytic transglycosylase MltG [Devosia nanyangense]|uniref:Endolytic murein transglycosylase n=1 Tax=Devosia nanyangense TaxID=1228055 RepID=A0A933L1G4_9HYPH|nr:endolytic transglycosylase MltG [Devosia nanyangense]